MYDRLNSGAAKKKAQAKACGYSNGLDLPGDSEKGFSVGAASGRGKRIAAKGAPPGVGNTYIVGAAKGMKA